VTKNQKKKINFCIVYVNKLDKVLRKMNITIEQAKAFLAIEKHGTIQKAAFHLHKAHSAVMYLVKSFEDQLELDLFDRSGYRNKITPKGKIILKYCEELLIAQENIREVCLKIRDGWEPNLKLVYDGVVDFNVICNALLKLNEAQVPTELTVLSSHLDEVEDIFLKAGADIMVTVLPIKSTKLASVPMRPIKMNLVSYKGHPLSMTKNTPINTSSLEKHTLIKIRGSGHKLGLSTEMLATSIFSVNDFNAKKQALLRGLGYGWMPEYLVKKDLETGELKKLKTQISNEAIIRPQLYFKDEELLGNTAKQLLEYLKHC